MMQLFLRLHDLACTNSHLWPCHSVLNRLYICTAFQWMSSGDSKQPCTVADIIQALSLTRCVDYAGYDDQGAQELMRMYQTIHTDHKVRVTDLTMCRTVLDGLILPCYVEA